MRISTLAILLLLAPLSLMAQFETGEVLGTVRDNTGAVVANAAVTLLSQDTSIETKTTSDEAGNYGFFNVKVGTYTITVETTDTAGNTNAAAATSSFVYDTTSATGNLLATAYIPTARVEYK